MSVALTIEKKLLDSRSSRGAALSELRQARGFSPDMEKMLLADDWIEKQVRHKQTSSVAVPSIRAFLAS